MGEDAYAPPRDITDLDEAIEIARLCGKQRADGCILPGNWLGLKDKSWLANRNDNKPHLALSSLWRRSRSSRSRAWPRIA
jgi:hypothetical protein